MRRLVCLFLLSAASVAAAQQGSLTVEFQGEAELVVGPTQCSATVPVDWTASSGGLTPCNNLRLWVTSRTACGDGPQGLDVDLGEVTAAELSAGTGQKTFPMSSVIAITGVDGGTGCGTLGVEQIFIGCGRFTLPQGLSCTTGTPTVITNSSLPKLIYDAKAPPAPTLEAVVPFDQALAARVTSTGTDVATIVLFVKEASAPDTAYTMATTFSVEAPTGRIEGLQNGTSYAVKAYAQDVVNNRSEASAALTGTPVNSEGFFGNYLRGGGAEHGGCSAVGGGTLISALLLLFAAAQLGRRR